MKTVLFQTTMFLLASVFVAIVIEHAIADDEHAQMLKEELDRGIEVVYFGDSAIAYYDPADRNKRLLSEMVEENLDGKKIVTVHQGAFYSRVFEAYMEFIARQEHKPQAVVVPINLRSFGPQWDLRPGYQFTSEIFRLSGEHSQAQILWDRIAKLSDNSKRRDKEEKEWLLQPVFFNVTSVGVVEEFHHPIQADDGKKNELIRKKFIYNYLFRLDEDQRNLKSLVHIIQLAKKNNITLVLYVQPLDHQKGQELVSSFTPLIEYNLKVLESVIERENATLYDFSQTLNSSSFSYEYIPDEHLNEHGKQMLAEMVAASIKGEMSKSKTIS